MKNEELLNGPWVVTEERTRGWLESKSYIFRLENFYSLRALSEVT